MDWVGRLRGKEPAASSPQRRAVAELRRDRVKFVSQVGSSGIVEIQAEASQPQIALDIANTYIEVLLARTRSFNVDDAKSTREYLSQQTTQSLRRAHPERDRPAVIHAWREAECRSRPRARRPPSGCLSSKRRSPRSRPTGTSARRVSAALKTKLESMPARQTPTKSAAPATPPVNPANAPRLRSKLSSLEAQMVEARSRYAEDHPRIRLLGTQIAEVQTGAGRRGEGLDRRRLQRAAPIPADDRDAFAEMVVALETSVASLSAQEGAIKDQVAALRRDLSGLSKDELEYRRLASEVETNRKLSTLLSDKLGAARIREQGEMNVVKVIDPPGFPSTAPNQRRMQFMGLALALALIIGLGAPATAEYFNRPIMGEADVKNLTGLSSAGGGARRSRRRIWCSARRRSSRDPRRTTTSLLTRFDGSASSSR